MAHSGLGTQYFEPTCKVVIPEPTTDLHDVVDRWSDSNVSLPAVVVTPTTEDDILAAIRFAKAAKLKLIPAGGGHAPFVPINDKTLYLDMKNFKKIELDEVNNLVTVGAGVKTGEVLRECTEKGYYTVGPNSNAVGVVGAVLGGGSTPFNGLHGFMIDHVRSIRLITAAGRTLTLTPDSPGEDGDLFNSLCGGGLGLGVVTALSVDMFRTSDLNMDNNQVWVHRQIFPASEIKFVTELFTSRLPPSPKSVPLLLFTRSPPTSPNPGTPMIMMNWQYLGPHAEAEQVLARVLSPEVAGKAIMSQTSHVPLARVNDMAEMINSHGGFKDIHGSFQEKLEASSLQDAFSKWIEFGDENPDAKAKPLLAVVSWDTEVLLKNGKEDKEGRDKKFFSWRHCGVYVGPGLWYGREQTKAASDRFGKEILGIIRAGQRLTGFANNLIIGMDMTEIWPEEKLEELKRVKYLWDDGKLFWSPTVDGV